MRSEESERTKRAPKAKAPRRTLRRHRAFLFAACKPNPVTDHDWQDLAGLLNRSPSSALAVEARKRVERILGLYEECTAVADHFENRSETLASLDRFQQRINELQAMFTCSPDGLTLGAAEAIQEQEFKRALEVAGVPREQVDAGSCFQAFEDAWKNMTVLSRLCQAARVAVHSRTGRHRPTRNGLTMIVRFLADVFDEFFRCTDQVSRRSAERREQFILEALHAGEIPDSDLSPRQIQRHLFAGKNTAPLQPGEF